MYASEKRNKIKVASKDFALHYFVLSNAIQRVSYRRHHAPKHSQAFFVSRHRVRQLRHFHSTVHFKQFRFKRPSSTSFHALKL